MKKMNWKSKDTQLYAFKRYFLDMKRAEKYNITDKYSYEEGVLKELKEELAGAFPEIINASLEELLEIIYTEIKKQDIRFTNNIWLLEQFMNKFKKEIINNNSFNPNINILVLKKIISILSNEFKPIERAIEGCRERMNNEDCKLNDYMCECNYIARYEIETVYYKESIELLKQYIEKYYSLDSETRANCLLQYQKSLKIIDNRFLNFQETETQTDDEVCYYKVICSDFYIPGQGDTGEGYVFVKAYSPEQAIKIAKNTISNKFTPIRKYKYEFGCRAGKKFTAYKKDLPNGKHKINSNGIVEFIKSK